MRGGGKRPGFEAMCSSKKPASEPRPSPVYATRPLFHAHAQSLRSPPPIMCVGDSRRVKLGPRRDM